MFNKTKQAGAEMSQAELEKLCNCHCIVGLSSSQTSSLGQEALLECKCPLDLNIINRAEKFSFVDRGNPYQLSTAFLCVYLSE